MASNLVATAYKSWQWVMAPGDPPADRRLTWWTGREAGSRTGHDPSPHGVVAQNRESAS